MPLSNESVIYHFELNSADFRGHLGQARAVVDNSIIASPFRGLKFDPLISKCQIVRTRCHFGSDMISEEMAIMVLFFSLWIPI